MAQIGLTARLKKVQDDLDKIRDQFLLNMAQDIVEQSVRTVDTGAYITSHSIRTTRGAGRARTSRNKPQNQDPQFEAAESLSQLYEDIASIPKDQVEVFLTNNAPHANIVEYGNATWKKYPNGYRIYESVRSRSSNHLQDAINQVRGSQ
jgi:hypothetical protein